MNKFSWILIVFCCTLFIACDKNEDSPRGGEDISFTLADGSIIVTKNPDITISSVNTFPEGIATDDEFFASRNRMRLKSTNDEDESVDELRGNDYRFKELKGASTLKVDGTTVQATHVKIIGESSPYYAFVSYNERGNGCKGGLIIFKVAINEDAPLAEIEADVDIVDAFVMPNAELSAVDYNNNTLYVTGASKEPGFGYEKGDDYAFYMALSLNADKTLKKEDPIIKKLTSNQGTSVRAANNRVYVTTGAGVEGTEGGLYIFDALDHSLVKFITGKDHVRSVDVDVSNIYLMQAEPARITKYDLDGNNETSLYTTTDESLQKEAKSEILVWEDYVFVAENESGLRMLTKSGGMNDRLDAPGNDPEKHVTNSVAMNSDTKKNAEGKGVESNLLFLANGEMGIYWYDIMDVEEDGKERIVLCNDNRFTFGEGYSANYIASKGNIVFVADGLGGLKILYIGFNPGDTPPVVSETCDEFMPVLLGMGSVQGLLPPSRSVFGSSAHAIIKTLFESTDNVPGYVKITEDTRLYLSYMGSWAGWKNSLGYFVVPSSVADEDIVSYYNNNIKSDLCTKSGKTNILKDKYTIFKNITNVNSGGPLTTNSTFDLGNFKKGDRIILFMTPNGWSAQNDRVEVSFSGWNQVFFTYAGINKETGVTYGDKYREDFKGIQYNSFYSADCESIVLFFEDNHSSSDVDYNDIVFSISDNTNKERLARIEIPKYAIVADDAGQPKLVESVDLPKE